MSVAQPALTVAPPVRLKPQRSVGLIIVYALTAAALLLLTVYPMVWLLIGSLSDRDGGYSVANYIELHDKFGAGGVLINSWVFAFGAAAAATITGVLLAVLVARTDVPLKKLARFSAILAFVSPPWLTAMAYVYIASPNAGLVNQLFDQIVGIKPFDIQSMSGMIFVTALFLYSFVFLTVEAALSSVDGSFEEAARVAGARPLRVIRTVTLPLVTPAIVSATAFSIIIAWGLFAVPAILGMPARIYVFSTQLYLFLSSFPPRLELAAAMGVTFVATALVVGMLVWVVQRRRQSNSFAVVIGKGARAAAVPLRRWRPVAALFIVLLSLLSVIGPYLVVLWMSLNTRWFGNASLAGLSLANFDYVVRQYFAFWQISGNTLRIAAMEVVIVLLVATAVSYFTRRTKLRGRFLLQGAAMYTLLVPSVAFLTAVMWAWIGAPIALYGGLTLIAMTQAARSLPIATRNIGDGFGQIDRSLEEAARICGAGRLRTLATVTLPLLRPVLLAAFTVVFLSALRDLNTPLFLGGGSTKSMTLSVLIFQFWSETRIGEAAALTIILLSVTLAIFLPLSRTFSRGY
ncbi:ABC transporter permease [Chelatococcus asaccharovorans]|uniref:Iron(III) transport system permease protein n=1 Tax=Chelatococcus asaccharovorans TaxID=28210 RepID=A0A2V3U4F3_9HYPH|nr:iron ABC transporter permease [Chelatococcus asaccharovorans]MBS7703081.1 iron ABC transporter permease [Chelatococcus asaccharovorans]PXW57381.1 iron(III) transport system permease protein [Chelatococcus asaccharovorans]